MKSTLCAIVLAVLSLRSASFPLGNCPNCFENRLSQQRTETDTLFDAARNLILDYIRDAKRDSIRILVAYCDSAFSPDSSWITLQERYLIRYVLPDTNALYDLDYYTGYYPLYDSRKPRKSDTWCFPGRTAAPRSRDNLTKVLKAAARAATPGYARAYPRFRDVWTFYNMLDSSNTFGYRRVTLDLDGFRKKFPRSPLSRLRIRDGFAGHWGSFVRTGMDILVGQRYYLTPLGPRNVIPNHPSTFLGFDLYAGDAVAAFYVDVAQTHTTKKISDGVDTLPAHFPVDPAYLGVDLGWRLWVRANLNLVAQAGIFSTSLSPQIDSTKIPLIRYNDSRIYGLKLGLDANYLFGNNASSAFGTMLRISAGMYMANARKMDPSFDNVGFFAGVSLGGFVSHR
jgi:hypothetical protein